MRTLIPLPASPTRAWPATNQTAIAGELANREGWVATSFYGQMALRNCNVDKFKRRRQEWTEAEEARERKAAMFADLLADEEKATEEAAMSGKKRKVSSVGSNAAQSPQYSHELSRTLAPAVNFLSSVPAARRGQG